MKLNTIIKSIVFIDHYFYLLKLYKKNLKLFTLIYL